jgi:hypothetical protein
LRHEWQAVRDAAGRASPISRVRSLTTGPFRLARTRYVTCRQSMDTPHRPGASDQPITTRRLSTVVANPSVCRDALELVGGEEADLAAGRRVVKAIFRWGVELTSEIDAA